MSMFRILVVDDEEAMRESLAAWLMKDGYAVEIAASGREALETLAGDDGFDLIESMDGCEAYVVDKNHNSLNTAGFFG